MRAMARRSPRAGPGMAGRAVIARSVAPGRAYGSGDRDAPHPLPSPRVAGRGGVMAVRETFPMSNAALVERTSAAFSVFWGGAGR